MKRRKRLKNTAIVTSGMALTSGVALGVGSCADETSEKITEELLKLEPYNETVLFGPNGKRLKELETFSKNHELVKKDFSRLIYGSTIARETIKKLFLFNKGYITVSKEGNAYLLKIQEDNIKLQKGKHRSGQEYPYFKINGVNIEQLKKSGYRVADGQNIRGIATLYEDKIKKYTEKGEPAEILGLDNTRLTQGVLANELCHTDDHVHRTAKLPIIRSIQRDPTDEEILKHYLDAKPTIEQIPEQFAKKLAEKKKEFINKKRETATLSFGQEFSKKSYSLKQIIEFRSSLDGYLIEPSLAPLRIFDLFNNQGSDRYAMVYEFLNYFVYKATGTQLSHHISSFDATDYSSSFNRSQKIAHYIKKNIQKPLEKILTEEEIQKRQGQTDKYMFQVSERHYENMK